MDFNILVVVLQSVSSTKNKKTESAREEVELVDLDEEETGTNEPSQVITLEEEEKLLNADDFEDEMMVVDVDEDQNNMSINDNLNGIVEERRSDDSNAVADRSKEIMEDKNLQRQRDINFELAECCRDERFSEYINNKPTWEEFELTDSTPYRENFPKNFNTLNFTTAEKVSNEHI